MCLSENGYQIFTYEEQLLFCSRSFLWFGAHKQKMWWQSLPTEARWTNWWSSWRAPWTWWPRRLSRNRWLHVKAWLLSSPRTRNVWGPLPSEGIFSEVEDFRVKKKKGEAKCCWWKKDKVRMETESKWINGDFSWGFVGHLGGYCSSVQLAFCLLWNFPQFSKN